jgi:chorismate synthase
MRKRKDRPIILSGIRHGETMGSPIAIFIPNGEREKWAKIMSPHRVDKGEGVKGEVRRPRPGHADLTGALKYGKNDVRDILERSSARETAARVALGACARAFLGLFGIEIGSHVVSTGSVVGRGWYDGVREDVMSGKQSLEDADADPVRCLNSSLSKRIMSLIDTSREAGDTLGGIFEVIAAGVPVGLGSYVHWDRRLDSRLAAAMMSIPGVKGVEIGPAFENAGLPGSSVHDVIHYGKKKGDRRTDGFFRETNRAGGMEGGISNGEEVVIRAAMKPIPTLKKPLESIDLKTLEPGVATVERGDVCAVPAAGVIGESMASMVIADLLLEKFGGDSIVETKRNMEMYLKGIQELFRRDVGEPG